MKGGTVRVKVGTVKMSLCYSLKALDLHTLWLLLMFLMQSIEI